MDIVAILWDESYLWGLLVWRALRALGLPQRVIRSKEIAQECLSSKRPVVIVAPGGVARRKAASLGQAGMKVLREYVASGGAYVGFCGGAGLGLTGQNGLGLCPWRRSEVQERLLHLMSGHIQVRPLAGHRLVPTVFRPKSGHEPNELALVPVWWPARFAPEVGDTVTVLATYEAPGPDFWITDLPLASLPMGTLHYWEKTYGVRLRPTSLTGQPCIVHGVYGRGEYVLSYAHLETPDSPDANTWLFHLLSTLIDGSETKKSTNEHKTVLIPTWDPATEPVRWEHPTLESAWKTIQNVLALGREHFLLFTRNNWLMGWRSGIPGAHLNHLHALTCQARTLPATADATTFLEARQTTFLEALAAFQREATGYLMAERLAITLSSTMPNAVSQESLKRQRAALFGQAMEQNGLFAVLQEVLDELVWRQLQGAEVQTG
ncbi:Biotin--protein ligase [Desulfovibrionales bacterium]